MAHASARQHVGGGAKIADFWRISADFDPISEGTQPRAAGRAARAFVPAARVAGRLPVPTASGPNGAVAGLISGNLPG